MRWFDIADELLPPVYRAVKDVYYYAKSLNDEFLEYLSTAERILNNFFIQRCDIQTIEYWEDLLNITLHGSETIGNRRNSILNHLNNINPTTEPYVRSVIERMFPDDEYNLHFYVERGKQFDLDIDIFTTDNASLSEFKDWFNDMCPAHLNYLVSKAMEANVEREMVVNHGCLSAFQCDLGLVLPSVVTNVYGSMSRLADGSASKVAPAGMLKMPLVFKATTQDYALYAIRLPSAAALTEHRSSYIRSLNLVFRIGLKTAGAVVDDWVNTNANFLYYENRETLYYETLTEASAMADTLNASLYAGTNSAPYYVELFDGGFFGFVKK